MPPENTLIDKIAIFNLMDRYIDILINGFVRKKDDLIREAIKNAGADPDDNEFLKENLYLITRVGSPFEHYYLYCGSPKQIRLISFERDLDFSTGLMDEFKLSASQRYY